MNKIKILGMGCSKCHTLYERTCNFVKDNCLNFSVEKVEDMSEILKYQVISTPAFVVNDEILSTGKLLNEKDLRKILMEDKQ